MRRLLAPVVAVAAALALTACSGPAPFVPKVDPWVVANHDEKVAYHSSAVEEFITLDATASIAGLEAFQAVGYFHLETGSNGSLHVEYLSSVDGESYVSRRVSDDVGYAFDQSHVGGASTTYYLLGDKIKSQLAKGKSWVQLAAGDLGRLTTPEKNCSLYAVSYLCTINHAWDLTRESTQDLPVQLSEGERGDRHFATAVSYASLIEAGLLPADGKFDGFLTDQMRATLIPMHLWVADDGVVTKVEVNGVLTGDNGEQLKLQTGFEITSRAPSTSMVPVTDGEIPANDVYRITTSQQLDDFVKRLSQL